MPFNFNSNTLELHNETRGLDVENCCDSDENEAVVDTLAIKVFVYYILLMCRQKSKSYEH